VILGAAAAPPGDDPSLGDVMVATSILDHAAEAVLGDGSRAFAAAPIDAAAAALAAELSGMDLGDWAAAVDAEQPPVALSLRGLYGTKRTKAEVLTALRRRAAFGARPPRVVTGAMLASDVPLDDAELMRLSVHAERRFRAVEMETAGVHRVAHERGVPVLVARGVGEIIGAHRVAPWEAYARRAAASFVGALIRSGALARPADARGAPRPRLASVPPASARPADALSDAARLALLGDAALERADVEAAAALYGEAMPLYRAAGDLRGEAMSVLRFGEIALRRGDVEEARRRYLEALPLFRRVQDALGEANCVARLGDVALRRGDAEEARRRHGEALPLYRRAGDVQGEANCVLRLGDLAQKRGDVEEARAQFEEALGLYAHVAEPYSMGMTHRKLARLAPDERLRRRHLEAARELWARAGRADLTAKIDAELEG
jgi:tetratricopeptide (TPR) repeat protein